MSSPQPERCIHQRMIYRGKVLNVYVDRVRCAGGIETIREVVDHSPAVAIVPRLSDGRVILVQQQRYAVRSLVWEIPAGLMERKETPLQAARRELREETGYRAHRWKRLGRIYSSPGFTNETIHLYLAEGLYPEGGLQTDADEFLRVKLWSWAKALNWARRGVLRDGKTVLGLLLVDQNTSGRKTVPRRRKTKKG